MKTKNLVSDLFSERLGNKDDYVFLADETPIPKMVLKPNYMNNYKIPKNYESFTPLYKKTNQNIGFLVCLGHLQIKDILNYNPENIHETLLKNTIKSEIIIGKDKYEPKTHKKLTKELSNLIIEKEEKLKNVNHYKINIATTVVCDYFSKYKEELYSNLRDSNFKNPNNIILANQKYMKVPPFYKTLDYKLKQKIGDIGKNIYFHNNFAEIISISNEHDNLNINKIPYVKYNHRKK